MAERVGTDQNLSTPCQTLQTLRCIDRITDGVVIESPGRTDLPDNCLTGVNADALLQIGQAIRSKPRWRTQYGKLATGNSPTRQLRPSLANCW